MYVVLGDDKPNRFFSFSSEEKESVKYIPHEKEREFKERSWADSETLPIKTKDYFKKTDRMKSTLTKIIQISKKCS